MRGRELSSKRPSRNRAAMFNEEIKMITWRSYNKTTPDSHQPLTLMKGEELPSRGQHAEPVLTKRRW
jgi:hypothetical protein